MNRDCLSIVSVRYKTVDDPEKVRRLVQKKLNHILDASTTEDVRKPVKTFPEIPSSDIRTVVTSSTHVVVLLTSGRVCRFEMKSASNSGSHRIRPNALPHGAHKSSLQVQSDEQLAKRLQAIYNLEQEGRGLFGPQVSQDSYSYPGLLAPGFSPDDISSHILPIPRWPPLSLGLADDDSSAVLSDMILNRPLTPTLGAPSPLLPPSSPPFHRLDSGLSPDILDFDGFADVPSRPMSFSPKETEKTSKGKSRLNPKSSSNQNSCSSPGAESSGKGNGEGDEHASQDSNWPRFGPIEWLERVKTESGPEEEAPLFCDVAATHSEVLLVTSSSRALYCWPCGSGQNKDTPTLPASPHPLAHELKLSHGGVCLIKSSHIRTTVVLDSGEVATFYDPLLRDCGITGTPPLVADLTHAASPILSAVSSSQEQITSLSVGDFLTIAITESGRAYWWGLLAQSDTGTAATHQGGSVSGSLKLGSMVRLRDGPKYGGGTAVFRHHPQYGPQIGWTVDQMESSTTVDPSSVLVKIHRFPPSTGKEEGHHNSRPDGGTYLEKWSWSQVTLLEDSTPVLGKLIVIDNGQAIVEVPTKDTSMASDRDSPSGSSHLKVFKVSDIQVVASGLEQPTAVKTDPTQPSSSHRASSKQLTGCRQHAAGVVQKIPVCFVSAVDDVNSEMLFDVTLSSSESVVFGFRPLAAHIVEDKPLVLLERLSDGKAFLLLSSKSSSSFLQSSSFVSLGSPRSSLPKCTIEEESVCSRDSSLVCSTPEEIFDFCFGGEFESSSTPSEKTQTNSSQKLRQRKRTHVDHHDARSTVLPMHESKRKPCIVSNSFGSVLLLHDTVGGVHLLDNGLSLKMMTSSCFTSPYTAVCVEDRVIDGYHSAMVFVLAPSPPCLLDSVETGNADAVISAIDDIAKSLTRKVDLRRASKGKYRVNESGAKRRKISSLVSAPNEETTSQQEGASSSPLNKEDACVSVSPLIARTIGNRNICHLCCCHDDVQEEAPNSSEGHSSAEHRKTRSSGGSSKGDSLKDLGKKVKTPKTSNHLKTSSFDLLRILGSLLDCEGYEMKAVVRHLLSSKNSEGCTPFMSALVSGNHKAALAILKYVLTEDGKNRKLNFLENAILQQNVSGMGPLQLLIQGILPPGFPYDSNNKMVCVYNLPPGVTAQQLMDLFKSYYPSVYRVEVKGEDAFRRSGRDSDTSDSDEDSDPTLGRGQQEGDEHVLGRVPPSLASRSSPTHWPYGIVSRSADGGLGNERPWRRHRRGRRMRDMEGAHVAFIYFSNLHQLRSALNEMNKHRISVNSSSRGAGFGSSINVRAIEIEVDAYISDGSEDPSAEWVQLRRRVPRMNFEEKRKKCQRIGSTTEELLSLMLENEQICSMKDENEESAIASLLHNQAALKLLCMGGKEPPKDIGGTGSKAKTMAEKRRKMAEMVRSLDSGRLSNLQSSMESYLRSMARSLGIFPLPHIDPPSLFTSQQSSANTSCDDDENSTVENSTPNSSSGESPTQTTSSTLSSKQQTPKSAQVPSQPSLTTPPVPSPLTLSVSTAPMLGNSPVVPEASNKDENIMATNELSSLFDSAGAVGDYMVIDGEDTSSERKSTPQTGGNESHKMDTTETLQKETIVSSSPPKGTPTEATSTSGDSIYILKRLFSNWSCVVTTILGYFPSCLHQDDKCPEDSASCQFTLEPGHVAHLDNFVQMLLYSRHKFLLYEFIKTVIHHMNADMADVNVELIYAKILSNSEVTLSKKTVGVVVGCVLLRSLVRLLTVEHSRPNGVTMTVTSSNSSSEASPSPDIPTSSRAQRNGTNDQKQILEVYKALKSTVRVFGSLSLLAMATACDGMMSPVRVGLTKPLGASSVCAEYQKGAPSRSTSYYRPISERGMQEYPHSTQLRQHIRSSTSYRLRQTSPHPLPQEGFRLRPKLGVSGVEMGDETMDDSVMDDGMDEEWGASETSKLPQTIQTLFSSVSFSPTNAFHSLIDEELSIVDNSDSSDSSEDSMLLIHDILPPSRQTGNGNGDQNPQSSVYEHAWALDGRVLGETFRGSSQPPIDVFDPYMDTKLTSVSSIPSIRFGAAFLTRTHTRLLKDLVDLALCLGESKDVEIDGEKLPMVSLPDGLFESVTEKVFDLLEPSWQWMCQLLDIAEGQLQQATNFDTEHFVHALRGTTRNGSQLPSSMLSRSSTTHTGGIIGSSPAEYVMYLLRAHTHESQGVLPVLDLYGYEHVVYTLDGFMYLLGKWPKEVNTEGGSTSSPRVVHNAKQEEPGSLVPEQETSSKSVHPKTKASSPNPSENFFRRSISVSTVGNPELGVSSAKYGEASFNRSVTEEIPLADQPHLLGLRLEGTSTPKKATNSPVISAGLPVSLSGLSSSQSRKHFADLTVEEVVHRWQTAIDVFAHVFLVEGPGSEQNNFLYAHAGVASRMARFRHQVSVLRDNMVSAREFGSSSSTLSVRVRRSNLLQDGLDLLKNMTNFRYQQVRVKFDGEDGSGPGVNRGFFTTFAHALKTNEKTKGGRLLHEPGKLPEQTGLFAPCPLCDGLSKKDKEDRKLLFVAIGRFLGLCLWFRQTIPLMICRHVAKFLLGRELAWHDLAFFNSNLYEGFRRMLLDAQEKSLSPEDFKSTYCCYFEAPFGDNSVELTPGGRKVPVTPTNVKEYVHLYAMFVMVDCIKEEMAALKTGLHDIIPSDLLSGITAEDFQLLLSGGCENISLSKLKSCVRFHHSHSGSKNISQRFEKMFWKVISQMTNSQRQQLLYFATGSSAMPLLNSGDAHGTQITIEVMGSNLESLPIASTCSQRISIPLYPSLHILRRKLHQAIQCQGYGLA